MDMLDKCLTLLHQPEATSQNTHLMSQEREFAAQKQFHLYSHNKLIFLNVLMSLKNIRMLMNMIIALTFPDIFHLYRIYKLHVDEDIMKSVPHTSHY